MSDELTYDVRIWKTDPVSRCQGHHVQDSVEGRYQAVETIVPHRRAGGQLPRRTLGSRQAR